MSVMLYPCIFYIALFVLYVACLTVFVNCLVYKFAIFFGCGCYFVVECYGVVGCVVRCSIG